MALTDAKVKSAKTPIGVKQTKLSDGQGLYLLINEVGKYWKLDYRFAGKRKTLSLGVYPKVTLKEARTKRETAKKQLEQNIDPSQYKKAEKLKTLAKDIAVTFEGVADSWIKNRSSQWATTTLKHKKSELKNHILPWIGNMKLIDIEPVDILRICQRVEKCGYHEQAHRIKMVCSQVLRFGVANGIIKSDPTRDLHGALTPVVTTHRPCLKQPKEVGGLMRAIKEHKGTYVVHCALLLSPYLFLRPKELRTIEWSEINIQAKTITIPAHKMKMKQTHIVPLSSQALEILLDIRQLTGMGKYVFNGARTPSRPMSDGAINSALRRMGVDTKTEHCAHGFRGTASTLLHELGYNSDYIERQLAHKEGNAIKAAYNHARHLPERTEMMQAYADYIDTLRDSL